MTGVSFDLEDEDEAGALDGVQEADRGHSQEH